MAKTISKASELVDYRPKPSLSVDARDLPVIKNWKIGQTYSLSVKVKMISISEGDEYSDSDDSKLTRARFRIVKVSEK